MYREGPQPRPPTATYFVDHPELVGSPLVGYLAAAFYWTVSRPRLNEYADGRNIEAATFAINGGYNGLEDRKKWYRRALAVNANLLPAASADPWEELMGMKVPSLSIYADPNEGDIEVSTMVAALDAHGPHEAWVEKNARRGHADSIRRVARTAGGQGKYKDAVAVQQALDVLNDIKAANPQYILAATGRV